MARIVVVGAGISGLTAAYELRGHDVTVVDGADRPGGKLRTSSIAGLAVDEGAEQTLVRVPEAVDLARAVGLGDALRHPATSAASVWSRGALHPLPPRTLLGIPASPWATRELLGWRGALRASADVVLPGGSRKHDVSVGALVRARLGGEVADRLVDPLLGGVYAGRADDLSLHATMPQLVTGRGSLTRAVGRVVGEPSGKPVFAGIVGGMSRLVDALVSASGAEMVLRRQVRRIERVPDGFRVVHGATIDEQALLADAVVIAVPARPASRLLADLSPSASAELAAIDYASMAIVTFAYRAADVAAPLDGSGVLVPSVERRTVKAITYTSGKWAHLATDDVVVVRCSIGRYGDVETLQQNDDELVRLAANDLHDISGLPQTPLESRVTRWGGGLPQYAVGHVERVERIRTAIGQVPGIAVCGAAYEGVGVPACIRSGQAAARALAID